MGLYQGEGKSLPDLGLDVPKHVVMTPYTAGASQYRAGRNIDRFIRHIEHLRRNESLKGVINQQLGYSSVYVA